MIRIMGDRNTGKTCQLFRYAHHTALANPEKQVYFVVDCPRYIELKARNDLNLNVIPDNLVIIGYDDYLDESFQENDSLTIIDDIERFLLKLNPSIKGYSLTLQNWYDEEDYYKDWSINREEEDSNEENLY